MNLANNEYSFRLKSQGDKTEEWFEGDFTLKCILNNQERIDVALQTDRYNGGSKTLHPDYLLFNRMIAELEVRIVRTKEGKYLAPTWWVESNGGWGLHDSNIIYDVFTKIADAEKAWKERLSAKAESAEKQAEKAPAKKNDA